MKAVLRILVVVVGMETGMVSAQDDASLASPAGVEVEPIPAERVRLYFHLPREGSFTATGRLTSLGARVLDEFDRILQRDFEAPRLIISSEPDATAFAREKSALRQSLIEHGLAPERLDVVSSSLCEDSPAQAQPACRAAGERLIIRIDD